MANISRYDPLGDVVDDLLRGFFVRPMAYEGVPASRIVAMAFCEPRSCIGRLSS